MSARGKSAVRPGPARKPAARKPAARKAAVRKPAASKSVPRPGTGMHFWLVKTDAASYSIDDLRRDGTTPWTGVRNYQARNTLRDGMQPGDRVLFYHSSTEPMAVVGECEVASAPRPDPTAFDRKDEHFDPDSDPADPTWWLVDLRHVATFKQPITRERLAGEPALRSMVLLQRGSRLSVQPVTAAEFAAVLALAHGKSR